MKLPRFFRRFYRRNHIAVGIAIPLILLVVGIGLVFLLINTSRPDTTARQEEAKAIIIGDSVAEAEIEEEPEVTIPSRPDGKVTTQWLFAKHLAAIGGYSGMSQIKSLRRLGKSIEGDKTYEVTAFNKDPNKLRISLLDDAANIRIAYNGEEAWYQLVRDAQPGPVLSVDKYRKQEIARNTRYKSPLYADAETPLAFIYKGTAKLDGETYYRLVKSDTDIPEEIYLDMSTFLVSHHLVDMSNPQTGDRKLHIILDDYRPVSGLLLPFKEVSYVNGELASTFIMELADINPGIPSIIFDPPEPPMSEEELLQMRKEQQEAANAKKGEAAELVVP